MNRFGDLVEKISRKDRETLQQEILDFEVQFFEKYKNKTIKCNTRWCGDYKYDSYTMYELVKPIEEFGMKSWLVKVRENENFVSRVASTVPPGYMTVYDVISGSIRSVGKSFYTELIKKFHG